MNYLSTIQIRLKRYQKSEFLSKKRVGIRYSQKGDNIMQVINPFNRVPETEEVLARGCHCYCSTGSNTSYSQAYHSSTIRCKCQCDDGAGSLNYDANYSTAFTAPD